jgi:hypothetical protein
MLRGALLPLVLTTGCAFGLTDGPKQDTGPIGTDTATDTDTRDDTGADSGETGTDSGGPADTAETGEPANDWPCGPYSPHAQAGLPFPEVSSRSTYNWSDAEHGTGTLTWDVIGATVVAGKDVWASLETGDTTDAAGYAHHWETTTYVTCDDGGLRIVSQDSTYERNSAEGWVSDHSVRVYDPAPLVHPSDVRVGSAWIFETTITETHDSGTVVEHAISRRRIISEETTRTVAAGTYTALHLVETDDSGNTNELWLAPLVGAVASPNQELAAFERFD